MTKAPPPSEDRRPQGIESEGPRRKAMVLTIAAVVLVVVGTIITLLGVAWWIVVAFVAFVFLALVFST